MKSRIKFVQGQLNAKGLNAGPEDGIMGHKTLAALDKIDGIPSNWAKQRKVIAFIQLLAQEKGIESCKVDGYWGPQTSFAFESLQHVQDHNEEPERWRPEDLPDANPNDWPKQTPEAELIRYYGQVESNQTKIDLPYPHKLSWQTSRVINRFSCHERVHDGLKKVLTRVRDHYGLDEIKRLRLDLWGGCLNVRKMRGGNRYSMHSWGIALDYDPTRNQLKWGRDKASFAKPEYNKWWEIWEEEGWVSLGRLRNFDWMHVQAAKL
ncbi:MAG: M15 family peptidase [Verrucomicrobia bacterium]|nr:M15 family peptidase [Verrucomicrobiota bacterium]